MWTYVHACIYVCVWLLLSFLRAWERQHPTCNEHMWCPDLGFPVKTSLARVPLEKWLIAGAGQGTRSLLYCFVSERRVAERITIRCQKVTEAAWRSIKINIATDYNPLSKAGNHVSTLIKMNMWIDWKLDWEEGIYVVWKYFTQNIY